MHVRNTVKYIKVKLLLRLLKSYVHYDTNVRLTFVTLVKVKQRLLPNTAGKRRYIASILVLNTFR